MCRGGRPGGAAKEVALELGVICAEIRDGAGRQYESCEDGANNNAVQHGASVCVHSARGLLRREQNNKMRR